MKISSFFNINGNIGSGAYGLPDFPNASDLLRHMDYLGVDRSLVWHTLARDLNPTTGNKMLLDELSDQARLISAFVTAPADVYENGALDFLKSAFQRKAVKALRVFPATSRFSLGLLERLLGEIAEFEPVIFWTFTNTTGRTDKTELADIAKKFPQINFVLTELMWGQFSEAVDLMWRAENIHIDTSWLHMRDTIELLCDEFGAQRVLFGLGFKSHYGAPIADLAHARISDEERELISHGNAERLLGLKALNKSLFPKVELLEKKPLWNAFKEGKPVEKTEVIDVHAHTGPTTRGWILRDIDIEENISNLIDQMDRCGVSKTMICPESALFGEPLEGNRSAETFLSKHSDRFGGYFIYNPIYKDTLVPAFDEFFSRGFYQGFKVLPAYWHMPLTLPDYIPIWEYANKHHLPILLHTWDDSHNPPRFLKEIAPKYPNAKFILGHSGGGTPGRREAVELSNDNPNVFLEFCGSFTTPTDWFDTIEQVGIEKVLFGSDTGAHSLAWELGRFLSIPLPDEELHPALSENFKKILNDIKL
jgi:predicted TIM-barrel fold metal-dependent hydrolase